MVHVPVRWRIGVTGEYGAVIVTWIESLLKSHGSGATAFPAASMQVKLGSPKPGISRFWTATTAAVSAL
jgi:hypothetical protein